MVGLGWVGGSLKGKEETLGLGGSLKVKEGMVGLGWEGPGRVRREWLSGEGP